MRTYEPHLEWDRHEAEMDRRFPGDDTLRDAGYHHKDEIEEALKAAGLREPTIEIIKEELGI